MARLLISVFFLGWLCSAQNVIDLTSRPYDLKGDTLGMSLAEFKAFEIKRHAGLQGDCESDRVKAAKTDITGRDIEMLGDFARGLDNCPILSAVDTDGIPETVAHAPTDLMYSFVDRKLYMIAGSFEQKDFRQVKQGFIEKFGNPKTRATHAYQNRLGAKFIGEELTWDNGLSQIHLMEYVSQSDKSGFVLTHTQLFNLAEKRKAENRSPDL